MPQIENVTQIIVRTPLGGVNYARKTGRNSQHDSLAGAAIKGRPATVPQ